MNVIDIRRPRAGAPDQRTAVKLPRTVTISIAEAVDGRMPVGVTVVPVADLEAELGVFVDFCVRPKKKVRARARPPADSSPRRLRRNVTLAQGDAAVAALLVREERAAAAHALPVAAPADAPADAPAAVAPASKSGRQMVSHQIAPGRTLVVGQAESFRVLVAPPARDGQRWFVRARFATAAGSDLTSRWTRLP